MFFATYTNKKGKKVKAAVSKHALDRFEERYSIMSGKTDFNVYERFCFYFDKAAIKTNLNSIEKDRIKKYRNGTLFLVFQQFVFVITDATIVTVEFTGSTMRKENKVGSFNYGGIK